jgi:hypothetical protein
LIVGVNICGFSNNNFNNKVPQTDSDPKNHSIKSWIGSWDRDQWQTDASLEIEKIKGDSLKFKLWAANGANSGELEGMAIIKKNIATFIEIEERDTCLLQFKLVSDSLIVIKQLQGRCFAGLAVYFHGTYKNSILSKTKAQDVNLLTIGVLKTQKQDSLFRALVGDNYDEFVSTTQGIGENEDLDGFKATVRSSCIRGICSSRANIIMINSLNHIWAEVNDNNKVYYFTNQQEYKKKIPKTIDNWRQNFKNYPINYK